MDATIDELTGLEWTTFVPKSSPWGNVAAIGCDIDSFNLFHSKYGQKYCEDAVVHVANIIKDVVPASAKIYRVPANTGIRSGVRFRACKMPDEFLILLESQSRNSVADISHALNDRLLQSPMKINYPELVIDELLSLSVGFAIASEKGEALDDVIQKAWDAALMAKTSGKQKAIGWNDAHRVKESFLLPSAALYKLRKIADSSGVSADEILGNLILKNI